MNNGIYEIFRDIWINKFDGDFIGRHGEQISYEKVKNVRQFRHGAKILRNVYLKTDDGETTEVDLIVLSKKGIWVFETKNVLGKIYGHEFDRNWRVVVGEKEHEMYNPIRQNNGHIEALKDIIGPGYFIVSMVMFSERAQLEDITITSKTVLCFTRNNLNYLIRHNWRKLRNEISKEEINDLYRTLLPMANASRETKMRHRASVKRKSG